MNKVLKGFSEKQDGSMYLPLTNPRAENMTHRKAFFEALGLGGKQIAIANLVHGTRVALINRHSPHISLETDALVTKDTDTILTLTGADCFPVYFEEKQTGVIGLAHCGWRGIVAGILPETLAVIKKVGGNESDITVTFGPGICAKHFEIQEDILSSFAEYSEYISRDTGIRVDLKGIMRKQIQSLEILPEKIIDSGECTYCLKEKYFSYRRDKPEYMETQLAYIVQFSHRKF